MSGHFELGEIIKNHNDADVGKCAFKICVMAKRNDKYTIVFFQNLACAGCSLRTWFCCLAKITYFGQIGRQNHMRPSYTLKNPGLFQPNFGSNMD